MKKRNADVKDLGNEVVKYFKTYMKLNILKVKYEDDVVFQNINIFKLYKRYFVFECRLLKKSFSPFIVFRELTEIETMSHYMSITLGRDVSPEQIVRLTEHLNVSPINFKVDNQD